MADDVKTPGDSILVPQPGKVVARSYSMWAAYLGLIAPELIDFILKLTDASPLAPEIKNYIRAGALVLIPILRLIKQKSLSTTGAQP